MIPDKRKARRRLFRRNAQILIVPNDLLDCALHDVSDSGARIEVEDSCKLPDHFFLLLSAKGKVQRACRVVWRKPTQLGVKFDRSIAAIKQSVPLPQLVFDAESKPELTEPD